MPFDDEMEENQQDKRRRLRHFPLSRLFPNMVTILGMCFGLSAIRFALLERWEMAVTFILIAIVIDGMDGRLARLLKATSTFGAQLDSLADFLNFGVAPALMLYLWRLHDIKGVGWAVALFFAICMALRLARFNTMQIEGDDEPEDARESYKSRFFVGVPAPAGAGLAVLPLIFSFHFGDEVFHGAILLNAYAAIVGAMLVSRLPTLSLKHLKVTHEMAMPVMVLAGIVMASMTIEPWGTLIVLGLAYLISLPVTCLRYRALAKKEA